MILKKKKGEGTEQERKIWIFPHVIIKLLKGRSHPKTKRADAEMDK